MSFPIAALVNVAIAVTILIWHFRRQRPLEHRAKVLRWVMVGLGISLLIYGNVSQSINRETAAMCALVGGLLALNFLFFPQLSTWAVRLLSARKTG